MEVEARLFGCLGRRFSLTHERRFQQARELARRLGRLARTAAPATPPRAAGSAAVVHPRWARV